MQNFNEFLDSKKRESKKELGILQKVFEQNGLKVSNHLDNDSPYIFVKSPVELSFSGVRVYKLAGNIAYRVQKEEDTEPYGMAMSIPVENMYVDLISDNMDEAKAGHEIIKIIAEEIKKFFKKSEEAEEELRSDELDDKSVAVRASSDDYSTNIQVKSP